METRRKGSAIQPTICPTEYRCYIKENVLYATAGAVTPSWKIPSSSGQLPVPVALNAELPTLFGVIIHDFSPFVNTFFRLDSHFCPIRSHPPLSPKLGFIVLTHEMQNAECIVQNWDLSYTLW